MSVKDSSKETYKILFALILGTVIGLVLHYNEIESFNVFLQPIGDLFIRLLKMLIVPLVLASIFMSIVNLGSPEELGALGLRSIIYYFVTTFSAVLMGLIMVNLIEPGVGLDISVLTSEVSDTLNTQIQTSADSGLVKTILGVLLDAVPKNPFKALAEMKILQVITFAIFLGVAALMNRSSAEPMISFMDSLEKLSMVLIHWIMKLAPYGVFALMTTVVSNTGFDALSALAKYMITVIVGLSLHFVVLSIIGAVRSGKSPFFIIKSCLPAMFTAFSTSSSASTLPISMACAQDNLGVSKKTAQFVLPLGATINMDGTALYESVAVIFIGQAYGLDLGITTQIVIFLTASLAAIGAAAIPGAGLVTMSIVLSAVGFPLDGIGLILAVDRILDMFRTAINVFGDCVGTVVVESFEGKKVEEII